MRYYLVDMHHQDILCLVSGYQIWTLAFKAKTSGQGRRIGMWVRKNHQECIGPTKEIDWEKVYDRTSEARLLSTEELAMLQFEIG